MLHVVSASLFGHASGDFVFIDSHFEDRTGWQARQNHVQGNTNGIQPTLGARLVAVENHVQAINDRLHALDRCGENRLAGGH
ncbi:hypothetical protein BDZ97DRAFT_369510 [Flammula alnicola]|nr:hypothetical protein BDZ97DRAFT_369510 [Flammula alnicola]